jgi:hypothetical protein
MRASPTPIKWHGELPVFAAEPFLKAVGDEYGWLGGTDDSGTLRCILPYTVVRRGIFRMVRFRVETIPTGGGLQIEEERSFLDGVVEHFRATGADIIIPATTNAIFRTYPTGADAAPYGSYVIDLSQAEDVLWRSIGRITRQNIGTARKDGVSIHSGFEYVDASYPIMRETFRRSKLPFMGYPAFRRFVSGLGENGKLMVAEHRGTIQSCVLFAFSGPCAYAIYAGNVAGQHQGANKLIYWEAMSWFRQMGIPRFDFVGARINPAKGSKEEAINLFKQRFGAKLIQGYIWKYPLRPLKSLAYSLAVRWLKGGDIVDHERHKLENGRRPVRGDAQSAEVTEREEVLREN